MVYFGAVKTASFYRASSPAMSFNSPPRHASDGRDFLAYFQTDRPKALSNPNFREKVRQTTELWEGKRGREVGEFADTESELIEDSRTGGENESMYDDLNHAPFQVDGD